MKMNSFKLILEIILGFTIIKIENLVVNATPNCLYCKRIDTFSSFLYSYSYCNATDECLADQWNYYNRYCTSGWLQGWQFNIDKICNATAVRNTTCPPKIVVNSSHVGLNFFNRTYQLPPNGKCVIQVDATRQPARIVFANASNLGVLYNGYRVGNDTININQGKVMNITIYNANNNLTTASMPYGLGFKNAIQNAYPFLVFSLLVL